MSFLDSAAPPAREYGVLAAGIGCCVHAGVPYSATNYLQYILQQQPHMLGK